MSEFHTDIPGPHTVWECAYRLGMQQACEITCICVCHGSKLTYILRASGKHVHDWKARVYHLKGKPDNMAIWCTSCTMTVPANIKPGIIHA